MSAKILIVEDSAEIRGSLKLLIELEGYEAIEASDGLDACSKAAGELPDLILMDLRLPGMDGDDAARLIHAQPKNSAVPILCVSSYSKLYPDRISEAGYVAAYTKTELVEGLSGILTKHLGRAPNHDQTRGGYAEKDAEFAE